MVQFIVDFNQTYVFDYDTIDNTVIEDIKKQLSKNENIPYDLISIHDNNTHHNDDDNDGVDDDDEGECDRLKCNETTIVFLKVSLVGGIKGGKGGMLYIYLFIYLFR